MDLIDKLEKETRHVFHKIHVAHLSDEHVTARHTDLVDPTIMGLSDDFFVGLRCADLGCGSAVHGTVNLLELGAGYVNAIDVDRSFMESAAARLNSNNLFSHRWELDVGTLLLLPYEDNAFDFVLCAGVIHHVSDDLRAAKEIYRILKPGAKAYLSVAGGGGLFNRFWMEIARDEYKNNKQIQEIVHSGNLESWLKNQLVDLKKKIEDDGEKTYTASIAVVDNLIELIDNDLILSMIDVLEAPKYKTYTESACRELLENAGFNKFHRFFKKPKYNNIRKIVSPLYHDIDNPLARILYGDGSMNLVVIK